MRKRSVDANDNKIDAFPYTLRNRLSSGIPENTKNPKIRMTRPLAELSSST
jgi:hypothetical protein